MTGWRALAALSPVSAAVAAIFLGTSAFARELPAAASSAVTDWGRLSLSTGVNYSTGDYGRDSSTDIVYVPVTAKLEKDVWTAKLTVPWISVTGPGNVVQGIGVVGAPKANRTTESGLGDVVASLGRTVYDSADTGTQVDLTGKVKFGTADSGKGLGTGEHDYSLALEPAQRWGALTLFGTLGYKVVGDPEGSELDNVAFASLGGAGQVARGTSAGLSFDVQGRSSASSPSAQRDVTAFVTHRLADDWSTQAYVSRGLAEASPDWAGGAMATLRF